MSISRPVVALAAAVFLVISLTIFADAMLDAGMKCDDTCSPDIGEPWTRYAGSRQWAAISWLGWGVLGFAIGCYVACRRRHLALAGTLLTAWAVACLGLATLQSSGEEPWMLLALVTGAVMLLGASQREHATPRPRRA